MAQTVLPPTALARTSGEASNGQAKRRLYFPQIDGLRFLAFFLVLVHHFNDISTYAPDAPVTPFISTVHNFGWVGVDLFLVISSFLIFSLLFAERDKNGSISIKNFYVRRALRIWPLYFAFVILVLLFARSLMPAPAPYYENIQLHQALPYLTFLGNFSYAYFPGSVSNVMSHLWTVSLEEQFYFVVPLAVFFLSDVLRRRIVPITIGLIVFSSIWRYYMWAAPVPYPMVWVNPITRTDPFILGALCAIVVQKRPVWLNPLLGGLLAVAGCAGFYLVAQFPQIGSSEHTIWQLAVVPLSAACIVLAAVTVPYIKNAFAWGPLPFLGKISYGLYVYHLFAMTFAPRFVVPETFLGKNLLSWFLALLAVLILNIALAAPSYLLYERPFLRWKERFEAIRSRPA